MRPQRGFTFIELLVVVVIVLLLISVLYLHILRSTNDADAITRTATGDDAVATVLQRFSATLDAVEPLSIERHAEACIEFHDNASYRVVVTQTVDDAPVTREVIVCCRGLGRTRFCDIERVLLLPPPPKTTP